MTFGETIQRLLVINRLKANFLAESLGYDVSYISKWINNLKRPSAKNIQQLAQQISLFLIKNGTKESLMETVEQFRLASIGPGDDLPNNSQLERLLSNLLIAAYQSGTPSDVAAVYEENAAPLMPKEGLVACSSDRSPEFLSFLRQSFAQCFSCCQDAKVTCVLSISPNFHFIDNPELLSSLRSLCITHRKNLRVIQIIASDYLQECPVQISQYLLRMLSYSKRIELEFYEISSRSLPQAMLILEDTAVLQVLSNPFNGQLYLTGSEDPAVVHDYYHTAVSAAMRLEPITIRLSVPDFMQNNISYLHSLTSDEPNRFLMQTMGCIHMEADMLTQLLERQVDDPETCALLLQQHLLAFSHPIFAYLYESTLVNFIRTGKLHLFGTEMIVLSRDTRSAYLRHLLELVIHRGTVVIQFLKDNNPLLRYSENALSLFFKEKSTYARPNKNGFFYYYVFSESGSRCIEKFFEELDPYCLGQEQAILFCVTASNCWIIEQTVVQCL